MDPLVSSGIVCYAGNIFGSVPWANRYILASSGTFGRTILVSSGGLKKTLTKSHDYSRLFSKEKRRLKTEVVFCSSMRVYTGTGNCHLGKCGSILTTTFQFANLQLLIHVLNYFQKVDLLNFKLGLSCKTSFYK